MKLLIEKMKSSINELKNTKNIAIVGMLIAIAVLLGFFATIQIGEFIKIGFSFIPNELTAMLFGPFVAGIMAGISDILKFTIKSTGNFIPGFTISSILSGFIYGFILYKNPISLKRIIFAKLITTIFINTILNTYWLTIFYGKAFFILLATRIPKQLIMFPIEVFIFYAIVKSLDKILKQIKTNKL